MSSLTVVEIVLWSALVEIERLNKFEVHRAPEIAAAALNKIERIINLPEKVVTGEKTVTREKYVDSCSPLKDVLMNPSVCDSTTTMDDAVRRTLSKACTDQDNQMEQDIKSLLKNGILKSEIRIVTYQEEPFRTSLYVRETRFKDYYLNFKD